jgi:ABC-type glutathione transport system ATPase component
LWLLRGAVKNKETAERILRNRRHELTEEQIKYLEHVIEEGRRVEELLKKLEREKRESSEG